jgi:RNA polymerase sigma factor (sigma-70 family)
MKPATDDNILEFLDGDDGAFPGVYHRYKQQVYEFCCRMLGDADGAKDVVQSVFVKVFERRSQLRQPERFSSWLMTMARNDCLTVLRRSRMFAGMPENVEAEHAHSSSDAVERQDEIAAIEHAIRELPPDLREVILLREYQELSYREISLIIGVDVDIVRSRIFRARQKLYETLKTVLSERN